VEASQSQRGTEVRWIITSFAKRGVARLGVRSVVYFNFTLRSLLSNESLTNIKTEYQQLYAILSTDTAQPFRMLQTSLAASAESNTRSRSTLIDSLYINRQISQINALRPLKINP
jgi:hypothetical protein